MELGISQTQYYKNLDDIKVRSKSEIQFIKRIVKPIWDIVHHVINPENNSKLSILIENFNLNIQNWREIQFSSNAQICKEGDRLFSDGIIEICKIYIYLC